MEFVSNVVRSCLANLKEKLHGTKGNVASAEYRAAGVGRAVDRKWKKERKLI